jgi:hypothetical protein
MTETLARPSATPTLVTASKRRPPRTLVAGVLAACAAALAGLLVVGLPVWLAWWADPRGAAPAAEAARTAGQLWLLAHGTSLELPRGRLDLLPLGLAVLPLLLLARAGAEVARRRSASTLAAAARCALAVAVPYAAVAAGVAALTATRVATPDVPSAVVGALVVALLGAGTGALRPHGLRSAAAQRCGLRARRVLPAVVAASMLVLAGGALLVGGSLAAHGSRASELAGAAQPGAAGGLALLLLGVSLVPNAAVWGAGWLAGPGFAVGVGTSVGPFAHELGAVPSLPVLAALPASPAPTWLGALALLLPVVAGALAGRLLQPHVGRLVAHARAARRAHHRRLVRCRRGGTGRPGRWRGRRRAPRRARAVGAAVRRRRGRRGRRRRRRRRRAAPPAREADEHSGA